MEHPIKGDARYTITREHTGREKPCFVARFCGEWIGRGTHRTDSVMLCIAHIDKRKRAMGIA
jgi:hypothetical protein